jgi:MOSC domain-containing protein YiiM
MTQSPLLSLDELQAALEHIRESPRETGRLEWIVRRPSVDARETLSEGQLDLDGGLVGDGWQGRRSPGEDETAHRSRQLTLMNARVIALLAQSQERWALAGDQLYVDFDLGVENLPPGTQLEIGTAIVEVTAQPHTGCKKFSERFGLDALKFVNSPVGRALNLRGINAKVVRPGAIRVGDAVRKIQ